MRPGANRGPDTSPNDPTLGLKDLAPARLLRQIVDAVNFCHTAASSKPIDVKTHYTPAPTPIAARHVGGRRHVI